MSSFFGKIIQDQTTTIYHKVKLKYECLDTVRC